MCIQHQPFTYITITTALYIQRITNAVADCTRKTEKSVGEFSFLFFFLLILFFLFYFYFVYLWIDEIIISEKGTRDENIIIIIGILRKNIQPRKKLNNVALDESRFTDSKYLIKWNIFCGRKRRIRILHPIKRRSSFSFFHIYICVYTYI